MVDDSDPRIIWHSLGRGLDRCYPPDRDQTDPFDQLLEALRERDQDTARPNKARSA